MRLPMAPSVPSTAMRGQVTSKMRPENSDRSLVSFGRRTSVIVTPASRAGGDELGVVVQELVQAVDDVHAAVDAVEQHEALLGRQEAVGRGDARRSGSRGPGRRGRSPRRDRRRTGMPLAPPSRYMPGIDAGSAAVDDAEDLVALGVADQAVGGLAVLLAELAFAVDDGGGGGAAPGCATSASPCSGAPNGAISGRDDDIGLLCTAQRRRRDRGGPLRPTASEASAPSVDAMSTRERYQGKRETGAQVRASAPSRSAQRTRLGHWCGRPMSSTRHDAQYQTSGIVPGSDVGSISKFLRHRPHCWLEMTSAVGSARWGSGTWCSSGSGLRRGVAEATDASIVAEASPLSRVPPEPTAWRRRPLLPRHPPRVPSPH